MKVFQRELGQTEKLFRLFALNLAQKGFDLRIFDEKQIKSHFGRGLYEAWEEALGGLHYRKILIIFNEERRQISWPSDSCPDRLAVNMARFPNKEALIESERELLELLKLEKEIS